MQLEGGHVLAQGLSGTANAPLYDDSPLAVITEK